MWQAVSVGWVWCSTVASLRFRRREKVFLDAVISGVGEAVDISAFSAEPAVSALLHAQRAGS